ELANQSKQAESIGQELAALRPALDAQRGLREFFMDPAISHTERAQFLEKVFKGRISPLLYNFMGVLNNHNRLSMLDEITGAYDDLLAEQLGMIDVDVTVAQRLAPDQLADVQARVSQALKKNAVIHQHVDDSIIGGLVLQLDDQLIDGSVRH